MEMNRKKLLNTVFKKYVFGYMLMGISLVLFLLTSTLASMYVSSKYRTATEKLTQVNNLQNAINAMSSDLNMSYSFLSMDGVENYPDLRNQAELCLSCTEQQSEDAYIREMADLNSTVESYIEESDILIGYIVSYIDSSDGIGHNELNSQYDIVQKSYSYVNESFQHAYQAKFTQLNSIEARLKNLQQTICFLLVLVMSMIMAACAWYLIVMVRDINHSILTLQSGVKSIEENIAAASPIELKSNDEFEKLADTYNSMLIIIRAQMKKIAENADMKERLSAAEKKNLQIYSDLQKSNLDFLQSRINPHFLFNTLNMILAQARLEQADKSVDMIELTATYLRYNLDNIKKTVTLEKEVKNLKDYISIQKYRYEGRFSYELSVDDSCLKQPVPCMVLQPLVENSIQHGIGMMMTGGRISFKAYKKDDRVIMEIWDNGVGASKERIDEISANIINNTSNSTHIGLGNIYQRLSLFYKEDITLHMTNTNPGMDILISIPYISKT